MPNKNVNYERKWNRSVRFRTFGSQGGEVEMAGEEEEEQQQQLQQQLEQ